MRSSVRDAFVAFTERFEGSVPTMYQDIKGLVTVAIGNLIDPVDAALALPFVHVDGRPATPAEISAEWHRVKGNPSFARLGWRAAAAGATLHLTAAGISQVVLSKLAMNERILKGRFPGWETWPADAQLGVLSMAWACGAGFHFPHFEAACQARDWATAAAQCHMDDTHNPGLRPRNVANVALFLNAAKTSTPDAITA